MSFVIKDLNRHMGFSDSWMPIRYVRKYSVPLAIRDSQITVRCHPTRMGVVRKAEIWL